MPDESSTSVRVTFLDVAAALERVQSAARALRHHDPNVTAVVLFGSLADGTATPSSDADILVLVEHDQRRVIDRAPDYARAFEQTGLPTQVLPWTRVELARRLAEQDPFAIEILERGRVLAGTIDR